MNERLRKFGVGLAGSLYLAGCRATPEDFDFSPKELAGIVLGVSGNKGLEAVGSGILASGLADRGRNEVNIEINQTPDAWNKIWFLRGDPIYHDAALTTEKDFTINTRDKGRVGFWNNGVIFRSEKGEERFRMPEDLILDIDSDPERGAGDYKGWIGIKYMAENGGVGAVNVFLPNGVDVAGLERELEDRYISNIK